MPPTIQCNLCGRPIEQHQSYIVRIEVVADPTLPPVTSEQLESFDFDQTLTELLSEMKDLSSADLQDSVHKQFEFRICTACQKGYVNNPLGRPREARVSQN